MRTETTTRTLYKFRELSEDAQDKAIERLADINTDYEWWDSTYEDAETIGLKITSFDLDCNRHAKGHFTESAQDVAKLIIDNHGETCETYKDAQAYLKDYAALTPDEDGEVDSDELDAEFERTTLEDYSIMLQHEYEYQSSREQIIATIEANDYEFTEAGKLA